MLSACTAFHVHPLFTLDTDSLTFWPNRARILFELSSTNRELEKAFV